MSWPGTTTPEAAALVGWPGTATVRVDRAAPTSVVPARALTFINLEPLQFSDGSYLELAA